MIGIIPHKIKTTGANRIFYILTYILLLFIIIIILLPIINIISQSFSSPSAVIGQKVLLLPVDFSMEAYKIIASSSTILTGFFNTIIYTTLGTALNIVMTIMCAYPLSRDTFVGRKILTWIFSFTMLFSGGIIPTYLLIKDLGLLNTRLVMILPGALSVWNMVLARTFFQNNIPKELYEAAEIDGANDLQILKIVIPLSKSIIATLCLFYAVGHWNSYFNAMLYLSDAKLFNLQLVLRNVLTNISELYKNNTYTDLVESQRMASIGEVLKYAIIVFSSVPIMCLYPFIQKYFAKGIMVGSLKG